MSTNNLNWTFDTVADTYEKLRPGYVDELYQDIFEYKTINKQSRVVEIGIGGDQATLPFLKTGCDLLAVDYGENFCIICREKFKEFPNFSAVSGKFEDVVFKCEYDLIYSASAFHWIPEEIGYKKVYDMLKTVAFLHDLQIILTVIKESLNCRQKWTESMQNIIVNITTKDPNRLLNTQNNKRTIEL